MAFSVIRYELLNPLPWASKKRAALALEFAASQAAFGMAELVSGLVSLAALVAVYSHPILGSLLALPNLATMLGAHEARVISKNGEQLFGGSFWTRFKAVRSSTHFTNALLNDTLVTKRIFGPLIAKSLEQT